MNSLQRKVVVATYEWKRILAKKRIYVLVIIPLLFQILVPILAFIRSPFTIEELMAWIGGMTWFQILFIQIIAIVVAGGSMSEEYEHGTAEVLLSKPLTRVDYILGKYFGGISLMFCIDVVVIGLLASITYFFYGPQQSINNLRALSEATIYSSLSFFSFSFMLSEILRRTAFSMLVMFGVLMFNVITGPFVFIGIVESAYTILIPLLIATVKHVISDVPKNLD